MPSHEYRLPRIQVAYGLVTHSFKIRVGCSTSSCSKGSSDHVNEPYDTEMTLLSWGCLGVVYKTPITGQSDP